MISPQDEGSDFTGLVNLVVVVLGGGYLQAIDNKGFLAPQVGLEPTTLRLTGEF
jgi:hypothetical protein